MQHQEKQIESVRTLITASIVECCGALENDITIGSAKTSGGELVIGQEEVVQVQVSITRHKPDFIGDFDMNVTRIQ